MPIKPKMPTRLPPIRVVGTSAPAAPLEPDGTAAALEDEAAAVIVPVLVADLEVKGEDELP